MPGCIQNVMNQSWATESLKRHVQQLTIDSLVIVYATQHSYYDNSAVNHHF